MLLVLHLNDTYSQVILPAHWLAGAACLFALAAPMGRPIMNMASIIFAGIVSIILVLIATALSAWLLLAALFMFIVTLICSSVGFDNPRYFNLLLCMNVMAIFAVALPEVGDGRVLAIGGGVMIASFCQLIFMVRFAKSEQRGWMLRVVKSLSFISLDVFNCLQKPEYPENVYLYERRVHFSKLRYFKAMIKLKAAILGAKNNEHALARANKLQAMFDILMDCAQLRRRVSDHTVFALCVQELAGISREVNQLFIEVGKVSANHASSVDTLPLQEKIDLLTNHFQTVLNVAAREPLAFLLFIASLRHLCDEAGQYV